MVVGQGDVATASEKNLIPEGVSAAFVPGKNGGPGTILIARETLGNGDLRSATMEELGEAVADMARMAGLKVASGDAGARLQIAVGGGDFSDTSGLFRASGSDTVKVRRNGEIVTAYARAPEAPATSAQQADTLLKAGDTLRQSAPQETITRSELLELLDIPPGTKLTPAFLAVYSRSSVTSTATNVADRNVLTKMFDEGVLYTTPDNPGKVFFDAAKIGINTLVRGILDDAYADIDPPEGSALTVNASELLLALQNMTGNWGARREVRPDIFNLPSLEQLEALVKEYDKSGEGELGVSELRALFNGGGLSLQTVATPSGDYFVKVAANGKVGSPAGDPPTVHPDVANRPEPAIVPNIPPGTEPGVEQFMRAHGNTSRSVANPNDPPTTYVDTEKLLDPAVVNWNGRTPSPSFMSMYQQSPEGNNFITTVEVQEMFDDGVLTMGPDGAVFGNMENVSAERLATGVIRWTEKYEDLYLKADPDFARPLPEGGVTNYFMAEKALGVLLRTNGNPVEVPSLYTLFYERGEDLGQGPIRYLDADGVIDLFASNALKIQVKPAGGGESSVNIGFGAGSTINQIRTDDFFGPLPPAGSPPSEYDAYEKLTAQELTEASGISLPQARILVDLFGITSGGSGSAPFLTRETVVDLLGPSRVLGPEPMELGAVLTNQPSGDWQVNWDEIEGDVIVTALSRIYPGRTSLQAQEIIEGLEVLFGNTSIDLGKLQIVADRTGANEISLGEIGYLFDRNMIKLQGANDGQSVTAVLDTEQDIIGSDPATANDGLIAGDDDVDSVFAWDADGSGYLDKVEIKQMFEDTAATPDAGMPVTDESLEMLAQIYAETYLPRRRANPRTLRGGFVESEYRFSREDVSTMLEDGALRRGLVSQSTTATRGSVLDLTKVPVERFADAVFDDKTTMTVDAFLDGIVAITGDVNPLKDGKMRSWFRSALGTQQGGKWVVDKDRATNALKTGVISFTPHTDGSHIRTVPNLDGLMLFNPAGVYDAVAGEDGSMARGEVYDFLVDFFDVPKEREGPNGKESYLLYVVSAVMDGFNADGDKLTMTKAEFLEFIEAAKTEDHGGQNVVGFDVETALSNANTTIVPVTEGADANFDTDGYTYDPETRLWQNDVSGRSIDNDGFLVDPATGSYIRDDAGARISVEQPLGPVPPDPNPPTDADGEPVVQDNAEFTPFDGPDGELFSADVTISSPEDVLNLQLESGEGSVSEVAIGRIFERYKNARPGSIERKHYLVMVIDSMRQRGLSSEQIGTQLTSSTYSGDRLMTTVFDADVYDTMSAEVANDAAHQRQFMVEYRREVDTVFAENFGLSEDGRLLEGPSMRPITFTNLLKTVADKILVMPDTYLSTATPQQQGDLLETFSLMNSFFAGSNDPLLVEVATKVEKMSLAAGASLPPVAGADGALDINLNELTDEQVEALNVVAWDFIGNAVDAGTIGSSAIGTRRIARFISLMATRKQDVVDFLKFLMGDTAPDELLKTARAFGFTPGEFDQLRVDFKTHGAMTMISGVIGVIGLTMRYGEQDSESLALLAEGDPRHIVSFLTQINYVSGYIMQATPDTAINYRIVTGQKSYGFSDMTKVLNSLQYMETQANEAWQTILGTVPNEARSLNAINFADGEEVATVFGLDGIADEVFQEAGLTRQGVVKTIQNWSTTPAGVHFIKNFGDEDGALQAIFITSVGGDDTYIYSAEAGYLFQRRADAVASAPVVGGSAGAVDNPRAGAVGEIQLADLPADLPADVEGSVIGDAVDPDDFRTKLKNVKSPDEMVTLLKGWGMSDTGAASVVAEMVVLNNWHFEQIEKRIPAGQGAAAAPEPRSHFEQLYRADIMASENEFVGGGRIRTNARQNVMSTLWEVGNTDGLFQGSAVMQPPMNVRNPLTNVFGAVTNGQPGNLAPQNLHTAYNPNVHGTFPDLQVSQAPSYIDEAGNGRVARVFKGLKTVGQYAEWGGDLLGIVGASWDMANAVRSNDQYDIGAASLGIANGVMNIAAMILAGSGGTLTIPISVLAGLTGVAQIIMGLVKPPESESDQFASAFMDDFSDFPEVFRPRAHVVLSNWHEDATDAEFSAWAEEQPYDDWD